MLESLLIAIALNSSTQRASCKSMPTESSEKITQRVERKVSIGMPLARVKEALDDDCLEYSYVTRDEMIRLNKSVNNAAVLNSGQANGLNGTVIAIVRGRSEGGVIKTEYQVKILVGKGDIVSGVNIAPVFTGP